MIKIDMHGSDSQPKETEGGTIHTFSIHDNESLPHSHLPTQHGVPGGTTRLMGPYSFFGSMPETVLHNLSFLIHNAGTHCLPSSNCAARCPIVRRGRRSC